jgi:MoxR-like ATPase
MIGDVMSTRDIVESPPAAPSKLSDLEANLGRAIRGKPEVLRLSIVCLLAQGHLLIEDVPGVGKTTLGQALARSIACDFHRLQFTSDMLPSDVLGVTVYNAQSTEFEFKRGPIFTNFLLADEINRATPKTQSALLEAMNELQVTIDGQSHSMAQPFMVIATQNPVEHHGTYPLPESQLDRFQLRLRIGYPDAESEKQILRSTERQGADAVKAVLSGPDVIQMQQQVHSVQVDEAIMDYILTIAQKTREHELLSLGVSPRGAQALYRSAQALALVEGRDYAIPDDVKRLVVPVCAHRVVINTRTALNQQGTDACDRILEEILTQVDVPL